MGNKTVLLIDGGHLRVLAHRAHYHPSPDFIEACAHECIDQTEELLRVLYYDCAPYDGNTVLPISRKPHKFTANAAWLRELAQRNYFAVREGKLQFHGWKLKATPAPGAVFTPTDGDFEPEFQQKGVDMRLGIDIANLCTTRAVEHLLLVTNDSDMVPALKYARIAGLFVVAIKFPTGSHSSQIKEHVDFVRPVAWPTTTLTGAPISTTTSAAAAVSFGTSAKKP